MISTICVNTARTHTTDRADLIHNYYQGREHRLVHAHIFEGQVYRKDKDNSHKYRWKIFTNSIIYSKILLIGAGICDKSKIVVVSLDKTLLMIYTYHVHLCSNIYICNMYIMKSRRIKL